MLSIILNLCLIFVSIRADFSVVPTKLATVKVLKAESCATTAVVAVKSIIKISDFNETFQVGDIQVILPYAIDHTFLMELTLTSAEANGDGFPTIIIRDHDPCKFAKTMLGELWYDFQKASGMEPNCPMTAGNFQIHNFLLDFSKIYYPVVLLGHYNVNVKIFHDKEIVHCKDFEVLITKK